MSIKDYINEKNSIITNLFSNKYANILAEIEHTNDNNILPQRQSFNYDPLTVLDFFEYKSKPVGLTYDFLKIIADRDPLVASIISTRLSQLSLFTRPKFLSKSRFGFTFYPIDEDNIKEPEKKVIKELEMFIYNTGFYPDFNRLNFPSFIKAVIRDRFRYDQVNFEILFNNKNLPVGFYAVDASTCRRYSPQVITPEKTYYQKIGGLEKVSFSFRELAWGVYFPRTDIENFFYGISEIEQILHILSTRIYADEYNAAFLKRGVGKGILFAKKSSFARSRMQSLREEMSSSAAGWYNAHRIPFISSPDIEDLRYIAIDRGLKDMEFGKYLDYLLNLSCAVFQIDPSEINFPNRGNISGAIVQTESGQEIKIKFSRDKGLRPLLMYIEDLINQYIVFPLTDMKFVFCFYGLDDLSDKEIIDKKRTEISNWKTVNEIRREEGLPPIKEGDIILNSLFLQLFQQSMMGEDKQVSQLHYLDVNTSEIEENQSQNQETGVNTEEPEQKKNTISDLLNKIMGRGG